MTYVTLQAHEQLVTASSWLGVIEARLIEARLLVADMPAMSSMNSKTTSSKTMSSRGVGKNPFYRRD